MTGFGASKLVQLIRRNEDGVSRSNLVLLVLMPHEAFAFEDVYLVLPVVLVERGVSSRLNCEMPHGKGRSAYGLVEQPLDLDTFSSLFLDRCIFLLFDVHFVEAH